MALEEVDCYYKLDLEVVLRSQERDLGVVLRNSELDLD